MVFFKENGPGDWRVSMRSKGDDRRQRHRQGVRRRRPQERLGLQRARRLRRSEDALRAEADAGDRASGRQQSASRAAIAYGSCHDGRRSRRRQAAGPDVARRRCRRAAMLCTSDASATPARSTRWPPACCRWHAAEPRASCGSSSPRTRTTRPRSGSASRPTPTTSPAPKPAAPIVCLTRDAVEAALAVAARRVSADAAGVLGEEGRGRRAYARARRDETVTLQPVPVRVHARRPGRVLRRLSAHRRHLLGRLLRAVVRPFARRAGGHRAPASRRCGGRAAANSPSSQAVELERVRQSSVAVTERWIPLERLLPAMPVCSARRRGAKAGGSRADARRHSPYRGRNRSKQPRRMDSID